MLSKLTPGKEIATPGPWDLAGPRSPRAIDEGEPTDRSSIKREWHGVALGDHRVLVLMLRFQP